MKNSGAKLHRLAAWVLTLALLLTSFTMPALALEDWENLSVGVTWTDAQGNAWTVPAWSIPEDAAGADRVISHGYWVTLDPQALGTMLTLQITHPDPAYTFWRADWSLQLMWLPEKNADSLDDLYADYIGYSYNGVPQANQQKDMIKLYVSTELPPFEVEPMQPSTGVPELIMPEEPEWIVPSEPEVIVPAEATIDVYYVHENGMLLDQQQRTLPEGTHTLWPESSRVGGYELAGDSAVDVTVNAQGQTNTASVTFYYRDAYVAPAEAIVPVYYYHENGDLLDVVDVTLAEGQHVIAPDSRKVSGLELVSENTVSVTVYENGSASVANVVFLYKDPYIAPITGEATVIYQLETGRVIEQQIITLSQGEQTVWPESTKVGGLELVGSTSVEVFVDGGGAVSPNPVVFTYREPGAKDTEVVVCYYDTMGNEIFRFAQILPVGTHRMEAAVFDGYELVSDAYIDVTVHSDGTYSPMGEELSFWYRPVQEQIEEPTLPSEPTFPEKQVDVTVYYFDTMGRELAAAQTTQLSAGTYRVEPSAVIPAGYELISDGHIDVTVHADGTYTPSGDELSFWYRPVQQEVITPVEPQQQASVTVRYLDSRGKAIAGETTVRLDNGTHEVGPDMTNVPAGYEIFPGTANKATIIVSGGRANQDYVNFYFAQTKQTVSAYTVKVYYYDTMGKEIASVQTLQLAPGTHRIIAQPADLPAGYELASDASFTLTVGQDGSLDRAEEDVGFWYKPVQTAPKSAVVSVQYIDSLGRIVSGPYSYELTGGQTYTLFPENSLVPEGYDASDADAVQVQVSREGLATPQTVLFTLKLKTDATVIPVGQQIARYGLVNGVDVAFRTEPSTSGGNKTVIFRAKKGSSVYMLESLYNQRGEMWTHVLIDGRDGYMQTKYIDMLTEKASDVYAQSVGATPVPTATPIPTDTPEPTEVFVEVISPAPVTAAPYSGYALTISSTALKTGMSASDMTIQYLDIGELVLVKSQMYDVHAGKNWSIVQTLNGQSGYAATSVLRPVTEQEAAQLIRLWQQQNATPEPTEFMTNTPEPMQQQGYAYTITDYVPFRQMASDQSRIIKSLPVGTVGYVAGQSYSGGAVWHSVAVDGEWGYIRGDLIRLMTIAEEDAYLNSLFATPTPTLATTNRPYSDEGLSSYGYVKASSVNFRNGASTQAKKIGELKRYALCLILSTEYADGATWYQVDYSGQRGYIHGSYFHQMTIREFSEFYGSELYQQGLANNSSSGRNDDDDFAAGSLPSVEDQLVGGDDDFSFEFEDFVSPVTPIPNLRPTATPTLEPIVPGNMNTPIPTISTGGLGMQESSSNLELPSPTQQVTYPTANESNSGSGIVWIIVLALLIVAGGGAVIFVQHQRKRRRIALRAAQRRAQAARSSAANRPHAGQMQNRTGMYPQQPSQYGYQNTYQQQAQQPYRAYPADNAGQYADPERPYARKSDSSEAPDSQNAEAPRRVGRRTAYQRALAEQQRNAKDENQ